MVHTSKTERFLVDCAADLHTYVPAMLPFICSCKPDVLNCLLKRKQYVILPFQTESPLILSEALNNTKRWTDPYENPLLFGLVYTQRTGGAYAVSHILSHTPGSNTESLEEKQTYKMEPVPPESHNA